MRPGALTRCRAIVLKDAAELWRNPGATLPALAISLAALLPPFLVALIPRMLAGKNLEDEQEFAAAANAAVALIPELAGLDGAALVQSFVFHQFMLFFLIVPVVGAMAIAAHAVISEKVARTLEPLLATPITTAELLAAKTFVPLLFALTVTFVTLLLCLLGVRLVGEPGVWQSLLGPRTCVLFLIISPLLALTALSLAVIVSSRVNDARSAQQLGALVIIPITGIFVGQLMGQFTIGIAGLLFSALGLAALDAALLWLGIRVFDRERILMKWR